MNPIDWNKVEVDTKLLVSEDGIHWHRRYFAMFDAGKVHCWTFGKTSWTAVGVTIDWKYAMIYTEEMNYGNFETDDY